MPARNGVSEVDPLDIGDLAIETRKVSIKRDGKKIYLDAYVDVPSCPASVRVQIARAYKRYQDAIFEPGGSRDAALYEHIRDLIMIVVDGIEYGEADVLAGDSERSGKLLEALGWFKKADDGEPEPDPEVKGEDASTGEASSPSLLLPTT